MKKKNQDLAPSWKLSAIRSAIALMALNTVFISNVTAAPVITACTAGTQTEGCVAGDNSILSINSGVTKSTNNGAAIAYESFSEAPSTINLGNLAGSLTNYGTISATVENNSWAVGVDIGGELLGTLRNAGTISATVNSTNTSAWAAGVAEWGSPFMSGKLINTGTISATATADGDYAYAYGVRINNSVSETGVIDNSGTISANANVHDSEYGVAYGIYIGEDLQGNLTNSGSISANVNISGSASSPSGQAYGIAVGGDISGKLTNSGTISATVINTAAATSSSVSAYAAGIYTNSISGALVNSGTISASANISGSNLGESPDATAIGIYAGYLSGSLMNSGKVSATASISGGAYSDLSARAYGINTNGVDGSINNSGTISALATASADYGSSDAYAHAYGMSIYGEDAVITNSGTITAEAIANGGSSNYAFAYGVSAFGNLAQLTNSGDITATASITDAGYAAAYGVLVNGYVDKINNSGNIHANANVDYGYARASGVTVYGEDNLFTNSGTINANASVDSGGQAYATGAYISYLNNLNNTGTISATAHASSGYAAAYGVIADTLVGTLNNTGTISATADGGEGNAVGLSVYTMDGGTINNSGTISGHADGGEGYSIRAFSGTGTINNLAGGLLSGDLYVGSSGIAVNNAGTIDIPLQSNRPGAGYVAGDYTQAATGLIALGAYSGDISSGGTGYYSTFTVGGIADLTGSNRIAIHATPDNILQVGDKLDNVFVTNDGAGGITGLASGASVTVLGTPLYNFAGVEDGTGNVDITVTSKNTFAGVLGGGIGGTLDGLVANYGGNGPLDGLLDALYNTNTLGELKAGTDQLLPLLNVGADSAILNALRGNNRIIQARLDANNGLSSGDSFFGDRNFWMKPLGSWASQDNHKGVSGYDAKTFGLIIGADGEVSPDTRLGVAFSYMNSNVDGNDTIALQRAKIDGYQVALYGSHSLDEKTELSFQADVGLNKVDGKRHISLTGDTARSDFDSWSTHIGVGVARTYNLNEKTAFIPSLRADYTYLDSESYKERGSIASLRVGSNNLDELILSADGKISHAVADNTKLVANLGVGYDVLNERDSISSAFVAGGASFSTKGIDPSPWLVRGGLGLVMTTDAKLEISARYDIEVRDNFDNQTGSLKLRVPF